MALKKPYVGYSNSTVHKLFEHLYDDKQEYLNEGYATPWDRAKYLQAYFADLDMFELTLPDAGWMYPQEEKY